MPSPLTRLNDLWALVLRHRDLTIDVHGITNTEDVDETIALAHERQHSIVGTDDHTSTATPDQMLKADSNGLPVDATNTDTEVSDAVDKAHDDTDHDVWLATKEADYAPDSMSVDTGTLDAGVVGDLAALGGTDVDISESTGADPMRVTFTFVDVTLVPNNFLFFGYYAATLSLHDIAVEAYNNDTTNWDQIGIFDNETAKKWYSFPIFNGSVYVNGSDEVQVRLRHVQNGINTHDLHLDYMVLQRSFGTGGGPGITVLDSPVDGDVDSAISVNWAWDHEADVTTKHLPDQTGATGKVLRSDGSVASWDDETVPDLDDLGDVNAPAPDDGDVLTWDDVAGEWVAEAPSGGTGTSIEDTDGDTKVQTEESADEDKIRFDTGGTERMVLDSTGLDLKQLKAIALVCDNGATAPASPVAGQWFLHTPTGRNVLMMYDGSNWIPIISLGTMTVYVDKTDGTDAIDKGGAVDAAAVKTVQYAVNLIPGLVGGNVVININAESYVETVTIQGKSLTGAFTITLQGTLTALATAAQDSSVQGAGATLGSITDAGAFGAYDGKLLYSSNNAEYRIIDSDTVNTATVVGYWSAAPSGNYTVYDWGTSVSQIIVASGQVAVVCQGIKLTTAVCALIRAGGSATFSRCWLTAASTIVANDGGTVSISVCLLEISGAAYCYNGYSRSNGLIQLTKFNIGHTDATGIFVQQNSVCQLQYPNGLVVIDGTAGAAEAYFGVHVYGSSFFSFELTYSVVRDCDTGVGADNGGVIINTGNNQYSGNTANETATAASYGYID